MAAAYGQDIHSNNRVGPNQSVRISALFEDGAKPVVGMPVYRREAGNIHGATSEPRVTHKVADLAQRLAVVGVLAEGGTKGGGHNARIPVAISGVIPLINTSNADVKMGDKVGVLYSQGFGAGDKIDGTLIGGNVPVVGPIRAQAAGLVFGTGHVVIGVALENIKAGKAGKVVLSI